MKNFNLKNSVAATLSLTLLTVLFDLFQSGLNPILTYRWNLLANLLIVLPLGYYVNHSIYQSKKLWAATFTILYVIGYFNILIEAWIFNVANRGETTSMLLVGIPYSAIAAFLIVYLFTGWKKVTSSTATFVSRGVVRWGAKILGANFLYFLLYILAGIILQAMTPRFNEFYADKIPDFSDIIMTNLFFRGFIFVAIAILIDRTIQATSFAKAILIGATFAILGGIAPLLPPNALMPPFIRLAHGFEVGVSNFLFGILIYYILRSIPLPNEESVHSSKSKNNRISEEPTLAR